MRGRAIGAAALVLVLSGCAGQTLLRWKSGAVSGLSDGSAPPFLTITSQPADSGSATTARSLSDRAAAAYITALAASQKDPDKLRAQMASPISAGDDSGAANDVARVLVIDVQRAGVRPADRFMKTRVEVEPTGPASGPDYIFTGYQAASTATSSINVGSVTITNQTNASLAATPAFGAAVTQGTASLGIQSTNASTHNISETAQLSVNVTPGSVTVLRTGGEGIDLVGNALVKLTLHLPEGQSTPVFLGDADLVDDKGVAKKPDQASMAVKETTYLAARDIYACARLHYVDRQVVAGAEYRDEGQQSVNFVSGATPWQPFLIVPKSDLRTALWVIRAGKTYLSIDTGLRGAVTLSFDDFDAAKEFVAWLKTFKVARIGTRALSRGGNLPLDTFADLAVVRLDDTAVASPGRACPATD